MEAVLYLWVHFLQRLFLVEVDMKEHLLGKGEKMSVNIQQQAHGSVYYYDITVICHTYLMQLQVLLMVGSITRFFSIH